MESLFECSTRYLTSERNERVRYRIEHEKGNSTYLQACNHVLCCLLYKHRSPQYYWNNFYLKATAVSVKAEDKSNSRSADSNKQFSNTFINTIENFSLLFYFHFIITTLMLFLSVFISRQSKVTVPSCSRIKLLKQVPLNQFNCRTLSFR